MKLGPRPINPRTRKAAVCRSTAAARNVTVTLVALLVAMPAAAYEPGQVTDGGTIRGKVVYQGEVGTRKIVPTKDPEVCGGIREEPLILVAPDKGVQDVVVY